MGHVAEEGGLHTACAELVHPEGRLVLQGRAAGVEGEVHVVVQQAAERSHVEVGEAHQTPGEVRGVVEGAEDAPELGVEQGLGDAPGEGDGCSGGHSAEGTRPRSSPMPSTYLNSCRSFIQVASTCRDSASW